MSPGMSGKYFIGLAVVSVFAAAHTAAAHVRTPGHLKHRQPDWQSSVAVEPDAPAAIETKANPVCEQLTGNIGRHIAKRQAMVISIAKSATAPPPTVVAAVKGLFGTSYANPVLTEQKKKVDAEDATISELNKMLISQNCTAVDVEHYGAQLPPENSAGAAVVEDRNRSLELLVERPQ
jgi:hypothetical protein